MVISQLLALYGARFQALRTHRNHSPGSLLCVGVETLVPSVHICSVTSEGHEASILLMAVG